MGGEAGWHLQEVPKAHASEALRSPRGNLTFVALLLFQVGEFLAGVAPRWHLALYERRTCEGMEG